MANILIIDDNPTNLETYEDLLSEEGHNCVTASAGEAGLATMTAAAFDAVLCDLKLPNLDGLQTMELAHERHGPIPWILITGHGSEEIAVKAIKQGAFNYLTKPVDMSRLKATVASAVRTAGLNRENRALRRELGYDEALERIVGTSRPVKLLKSTIKQVAGTGANVLIEGESGTGKELVADAVQALSERASRPYVKINTAAIPHELLESELFGHERGAFTGAVAQKQGKFEAADTGTIFLDEIGEMPMESQVKLLRVVQDGTFNRVGGNRTLTTDVRLICATNRNLKNDVLGGDFRMDLYYRLNVVNIRVPALRERREDIELLAKHFIDQLNRRGHVHKEPGDDLLGTLSRMDWPGNIRELENTIEKLYVLSPGRVIDGRLLHREEVAPLPTATAPAVTAPTGGETTTTEGLPDTRDAIRALVGLPMDEVEKRLIHATLEYCGGNKSKTARTLKIGLKTLYRKLEAS